MLCLNSLRESLWHKSLRYRWRPESLGVTSEDMSEWLNKGEWGEKEQIKCQDSEGLLQDINEQRADRSILDVLTLIHVTFQHQAEQRKHTALLGSGTWAAFVEVSRAITCHPFKSGWQVFHLEVMFFRIEESLRDYLFISLFKILEDYASTCLNNIL